MDPLAQLKDIHLPPPVGNGPWAIGWIFLFSFCLFALIFLVWRIIRRWEFIKARRYLLGRLQQLKIEYDHEEDPVAIAIELSQLLRRAALCVFPRKDVAGLKSDAWLAFLDYTGKTSAFTQGPGRALLSAPYQSNASYDVDKLFNAVNNWIKFNVPSLRRRR